MDERKSRPNGALILRFAPLPCRSRNGTSLCRARRAGFPPAPLWAGGQRLAMLGRAIRGWKTPPRTGLRWFAPIPVGASRAPSKAGGSRETFDRARGALWAPGELGECPAAARRAGNCPVCGRRSDRGAFSLVTFSCAHKRKSPAVGQPPTSNTRPQAARQHKLQCVLHARSFNIYPTCFI